MCFIVLVCAVPAPLAHGLEANRLGQGPRGGDTAEAPLVKPNVYPRKSLRCYRAFWRGGLRMNSRSPIADGKSQMANGQFGCGLAAMRELAVLTGERIGSERKAINSGIAIYGQSWGYYGTIRELSGYYQGTIKVLSMYYQCAIKVLSGNSILTSTM